jgi:hypothetical protein
MLRYRSGLQEVIMPRLLHCSGMFALPFAAVLAFSVSDASAQKKLTYEQAWAKCKAEVVRNFPSDSAGTNQRYAQGMSCMQRYGYRLKRSDREDLDDED